MNKEFIINLYMLFLIVKRPRRIIKEDETNLGITTDKHQIQKIPRNNYENKMHFAP